MNLTGNQIELLEGIQRKIVRGDIKVISINTGRTREYVGKVLSPNHGFYNEDIVTGAVNVIANREQNTKNQLKKLTAK